ncbi:aspartyl-phosphate phosphatase Spo0E family protein [Aquibacillus rhizosphaerae]|uniref:Aspartyl-phosphate phosphatase Spo0E family protein n=1 Tax=Aquibacillus rhizosphaerae TaxID=3051431 RepID=A0ABT7L9B6_9BACI|nr:aspartyl-phosphate phosphatase Spo0E family protein [Aquibacillus sp. LR5S19]MDL4841775.1 aspartyl-phosphate phosphatase Spo0E family protein [Aquibacillus sp. LR5S19]
MEQKLRKELIYNEHLISKIEFLRIRMIDSGLRYGLAHPTTVRLSQQLDKLMLIKQKEIK